MRKSPSRRFHIYGIALSKPIGGIGWARYKALPVVNFTVCCTSREILLRGVIS
jgi:hypothetical protein